MRLSLCSLLLLVFLPTFVAVGQTGSSFTYDLGTYTFGDTSWYAVLQTPNLTLIEQADPTSEPTFSVEDAWMVAGPAVAGGPAEVMIEDDQPLRWLVPAMPGESPFTPGMTRESVSFGETQITTYDSLRYTFERGTNDRTVAEHAASHYVLEAILYQHTTDAQGTLQSSRADTAHADLWFAEDLSSSRAPLAFLASHQMPFFFAEDEANMHLWHALTDRFDAQGLLLRMEQQYPSLEEPYITEVQHIRPVPEATLPSLSLADFTIVQRDVFDEMNSLMFGLGFMAKDAERWPEDASFSLAGEGAMKLAAEGRAFFETRQRGDQAEFSLHFQRAPVQEGQPGDLFFFERINAGLPDPGTYPLISATGGEKADDEDLGSFIALGMAQRGEEMGLFTRPAGGTITFETASEERVQGHFDVTLFGYVVPTHLVDPVELHLTGTFDAAPLLPKPPPEDPCADTPSSTESYGKPDAPNVFTLRSADGERRFHFEEALVLRTPNTLTIRYPRFGEHQYEVKVDNLQHGAAEQTAVITTGSSFSYGPASLGCFDFPPHEEAQGTLTIDNAVASGEDGVFEAHFDIPAGENGSGFSGSVRTDRVVATGLAPVEEGSEVLARDALQTIDEGSFTYYPDRQFMRVNLSYSYRSGDRMGGGGSSFNIEPFKGEPGVYIGEESFGDVDIFLIREFSTGHIRGERRSVPASDAPSGPLPMEEAAHIGVLEARFESHHVAVVPDLPPLELPDDLK